MGIHRVHLHSRRFLRLPRRQRQQWCTIRWPRSWDPLAMAAVLGHRLVVGPDLQLQRIKVCYRSCEQEGC